MSGKIIPKIGLFVGDPGGRLGRAIDLEAIAQKFSKTKNISGCEILKNFPSGNGLGSIIEGVRAGRFNRFLWIGRFPPEEIRRIESELAAAGINRYLHEWCDLEEQGIGGDGPPLEVQTQKAIILIQMALSRVRLLEALEPLKLPGAASVLLIGAGTAGLHTAGSLSDLGKKVYLIEKESGVGGKVASLRRLYPRICDPHCGLELAIQKLEKSDRVELNTLSAVTHIQGGPGNFEVKIEKRPRYVKEGKCNACGECARVCPVTLKDEALPLLRDSFRLPMDRGVGYSSPQKAIHPADPMAYPPAFVIDRQFCPPDCRECAKICPTQAVELEQNLTEAVIRVGAVLLTTGWDPYPLSKVEEFGYGLYPGVVSNTEMERIADDPPGLQEVGFIQCAGSRDERHLNYCSSVCCSITLKQVLRLKEKLPGVRCHVFYQDMRTPGFDEELYQQVKSLDQVIFVRGTPSTVKPGEDGKLKIRVEDTFSGTELNLQLDLLVLAGGMIPSEGSRQMAQLLKLPVNGYGFFESHLPCHPEESQRTGVRTGGSCQGPMNIAQSIESSHRAAMDLLPFLNEVVWVEPNYPVLNLTKCDKCKRCMEECPFQSFSFDANGFPVPDLAKCRQCGACMGACPLSAVSLKNFTIAQVAAQVKAVKASPLAKGEPVVLAFLCKNDAYFAAKLATENNLPIPPNVFFIRVPCAGAVNNALIADALAFGIDGVFIAGCRDGQCHYGKSNQLVKIRSDDLGEKLQKMVIEPQRVRFENLEIRDSRRYARLIQSYVEELKKIGPNPFKT